MHETKSVFPTTYFNAVISFLAGAAILSFFSTLQKSYIGTPFQLKGYVIPVLFGGLSGFVFYFWNSKLQKSKKALHEAYNELDAKVMERTKDLEGLLAEHRRIGERYRSIFHQSPIAIEFYDGEGLLTDVNRACLELFGLETIQEIRGFNLFDDPNFPQEQQNRLKSGNIASYQTTFSFEKVKEFELYSTSRSGGIHIEVLITPLGRPANGYLVQIQDITDRKRYELALQESEMR